MANNAAAAQEDAAIPIIDVGALVNDDATPDGIAQGGGNAPLLK